MGDVLEVEEAQALATVLVGQSMESGLGGLTGSTQAPPQAPSKVPFAVDDRVAGEIPCLRGGSYFFSGSLLGSGDTGLGEMSLALSLVQSHSDCVMVDEETGYGFTLNGDPELAFDYNLDIPNHTDLYLTGTVVGGVLWGTVDGRDGSCPVHYRLRNVCRWGDRGAIRHVSGRRMRCPGVPDGYNRMTLRL